MNNFKEYLVQEYHQKAKGFVAVEMKFSHSFTVKTEAKSGVVRRNDLIKVAMKFVDKEMNVLYTASIVFENNLIPKRLHKSFVNISPKELENRFNVAKDDICREILKDYTEKKKELEDKIKNLKSYNNVSVGVIPAQFKGESINIVESNGTYGDFSYAGGAKKEHFDM